MIANLTITGTIQNATSPIQDKPNFVAFDLKINENDIIKVSYWSKKDQAIEAEKLNGLQVLVQGELFDHGYGISLKADTMVVAKGQANNIVLMSAISRPEMRQTKTGKDIFSFSMRSKMWNNQKKENVTSWFKLSAWEKDAINLSKYVQDKHFIIVNGEFKIGRWSKDGEEKVNMEVTVKSFTFMPKAMQPGGGESNGFTGQMTETKSDFDLGASVVTSHDTDLIPF